METGEGTGSGMNDLKIFENPEFGRIRALERDGEPWFVATDVCRYLEIKNSRDALSRLDDDEKGVVSTDTPGGRQTLNIVNEYGLYVLVLGSRKKEAKTFKRWITHEVIPSIRKTGSYTKPDSVELMTPAPPELSLSGLASTARVARRAMLDIGASRWDAGMEVLSILGYYGLPVPGFIPKKDPGMIKLEDFFK